jgi:hypothetical protein
MPPLSRYRAAFFTAARWESRMRARADGNGYLNISMDIVSAQSPTFATTENVIQSAFFLLDAHPSRQLESAMAAWIGKEDCFICQVRLLVNVGSLQAIAVTEHYCRSIFMTRRGINCCGNMHAAHRNFSLSNPIPSVTMRRSPNEPGIGGRSPPSWCSPLLKCGGVAEHHWWTIKKPGTHG